MTKDRAEKEAASLAKALGNDWAPHVYCEYGAYDYAALNGEIRVRPSIATPGSFIATFDTHIRGADSMQMISKDPRAACAMLVKGLGMLIRIQDQLLNRVRALDIPTEIA